MKKEIETINKGQEERKDTISELKNTVEGIKSRSDETEASQLSDIEFKAVVIRILNELTENYQKLQGNYNELTANCINMKKERATINKGQEEIKNTISELKKTVEGIKSRLDEAEDQISKLEDKVEKNKHPKRARKGSDSERRKRW